MVTSIGAVVEHVLQSWVDMSAKLRRIARGYAADEFELVRGRLVRRFLFGSRAKKQKGSVKQLRLKGVWSDTTVQPFGKLLRLCNRFSSMLGPSLGSVKFSHSWRIQKSRFRQAYHMYWPREIG